MWLRRRATLRRGYDAREDKMAFRVACGERGGGGLDEGWTEGRVGGRTWRGSGTTGSLGDKTGRTEIGFNTRGVTIVTAEAVFPSRSSPVYTYSFYIIYIYNIIIIYIYTYSTATPLRVCVCVYYVCTYMYI